MFWKKLLKKQKITVPFKKKPTIEEIGLTKLFSEPPYFRMLKKNELTLYLKSPVGIKERLFKLPLRPFEIMVISTAVGGNKKFWINEMTEALLRHWGKFEVS